MKYIFNYTINNEKKSLEIEGDYNFSVIKQNHMPVTFMLIGYFSDYETASTDIINKLYEQLDESTDLEVKIVETDKEFTIFELGKITAVDSEIGLIEEYNTREVIEKGKLLKTIVRVR